MTDDTIERLAEQRTTERPENTAPPEAPIEVEDADHLEAVLADYDTVLVDFYAGWCGPCQTMEPAVERLAADDDVVVAQVDVDSHQALAQAWGVQGMPTLVVSKDGAEVGRAVGARGYDGLRDLVA
jgi:thioredoxin 1